MTRWFEKFRHAFRGLGVAFRSEDSFLVHGPVAICAVSLALWLGLSPAEWGVLLLTISLVFCLELVNSAVESLAQGLTQAHNPLVGQALDIAAGATLFAALGSIAVGITLFGPRLWVLWNAAG